MTALVGAPLAPDEPARALARFGAQLGITPAAAPREAAFAAGRLLQLGVDAKALERGVGAVTQDQLAAAARLFDAKSSTTVIAGGKIQAQEVTAHSRFARERLVTVRFAGRAVGDAAVDGDEPPAVAAVEQRQLQDTVGAGSRAPPAPTRGAR